MTELFDPAYWMFVSQIWIILGLLLVISDIFLGFNQFVLPVGVAALIVGAMVYCHNEGVLGGAAIFNGWRSVGYWFSGLSILSVGLLKLVFQRNKDDGSDVNRY